MTGEHAPIEPKCLAGQAELATDSRKILLPKLPRLAALVVGKGEELRPGHACRPGQGAEHFQHVGQLAGKVIGGGTAGLLSLFDELGEQRLAVARLI